MLSPSVDHCYLVDIPGTNHFILQVMEKLKSVAKPDKFIILKVIKSALEFIRLEGETESKSSLPKLLAKLDGECWSFLKNQSNSIATKRYTRLFTM